MYELRQKCRFDGNCIIDVKSRKNCMTCRMKKCIKMGMKKEFVINHNPNDSENTNISDSISDTTSSLSNNTISLSNDTFDEIIGDNQSNEVTIYSNSRFSDLETNRLTEVVVSAQLALIKYGCMEILVLRYSILDWAGNRTELITLRVVDANH
ncbi:unnamed protein product [Medioppia subpectinata]|uniref:Nuclear receptor domain-containing protein n=1 Tax=Medioppia subpectinata TaxID=1979941 RepID=A0A7R9KEJ4_9ACAR|nr:unnamed protein product [Medioppia subpectinata]CAG2102085.1 unnamed protein product [Medioppia subpectinata]